RASGRPGQRAGSIAAPGAGSPPHLALMASFRALLAGALLPFALLLTACGAPADEVPGSAPSPALWEVEGPEGQAGWLFGTAHALPRGARWRTTAIDGALGQARLLVVEIAELGDAALAAREL